MPPRGTVATPLAERFWSRVLRGPEEECWPWIGGKELQGYGVFSPSRHQRIKAHRMAYELRYGSFHSRLIVMHRCDNRICCNPAHLRLGTVADNNRDRSNKGRGRENRQWGAANPNVKLTEADVKQIIARLRVGETQESVADRFGIKQPQVSRIARRKQWAHLWEE